MSVAQLKCLGHVKEEQWQCCWPLFLYATRFTCRTKSLVKQSPRIEGNCKSHDGYYQQKYKKKVLKYCNQGQNTRPKPQKKGIKYHVLNVNPAKSATGSIINHLLRTRLLLLFLEESQEGHTRDLHNFKPYTRNITHSVTLTPKTGNQHLVLKVKCSVIWLFIYSKRIGHYSWCKQLWVMFTMLLESGGLRMIWNCYI